MDVSVVVGSANPVKVRAVTSAFQRALPNSVVEVFSASVASGVADQPRSDEETRQGAFNRAVACKQLHSDADFSVGLEGGLERIDGAWLASAWMVVMDANGRNGAARTPTLPLPPAVQALLDKGIELGEANDRVFSTQNSKQGGGAFGLLTEGRMTRESVYSQTVELALMPLLHPLWNA